MKLLAYGLVWMICSFSICGLNAKGNQFVLAQLRTGDSHEWDPYPLAPRDILLFLQQTTSVMPVLERRVLALNDNQIFQSPFLLYSGSERCAWTKEEREIIKRYLSGGGFMLVEDRSGERGGSFDYAFRNEIKKIFPDKALALIPRDHAVFRSFYLLRSIGGRKLTNNFIEGLEWDHRTALVYSQNDLLGAWAKDLLGNFIFACQPGGEAQRWESQKLIVNIILYSVTGSYKTDTIHIPFIEDKLRR